MIYLLFLLFSDKVDISANYEHIQKTLLNLEDNYGPVFMVINCAGKAICGIFDDLTLNDVHVISVQ